VANVLGRVEGMPASRIDWADKNFTFLSTASGAVLLRRTTCVKYSDLPTRLSAFASLNWFESKVYLRYIERLCSVKCIELNWIELNWECLKKLLESILKFDAFDCRNGGLHSKKRADHFSE
jgi:hypothetical protein